MTDWKDTVMSSKEIDRVLLSIPSCSGRGSAPIFSFGAEQLVKEQAEITWSIAFKAGQEEAKQ